MTCKRKMTEQGKNVLDRRTASSVAAVVDLDHAMAVAVDRDLGVQMFIRFVVGADGEHHRYLTGLITEARLLRDRGGLDPHQVARLEETYAWFNANLHCPPFSSSNWPKDSVSWFRDNAGEPIRRMWEIAHLLKEHGVSVRMLRSASPGKVLYEDSYQIVVEEWKQL
jgi:hypothetical protein